MKTAGIRRSLVVRVLLGCILFSLFACGLHHGQMNARGLLAAAEAAPAKRQAGHALHSHAHDMHAADGSHEMPAPEASGGHGGHDSHALTPAFSCPLCSSFGAVVAVNSRAWALPIAPLAAGVRPLAALAPDAPRRERWSTPNPRAPPIDVLRS